MTDSIVTLASITKSTPSPDDVLQGFEEEPDFLGCKEREGCRLTLSLAILDRFLAFLEFLSLRPRLPTSVTAVLWPTAVQLKSA